MIFIFKLKLLLLVNLHVCHFVLEKSNQSKVLKSVLSIFTAKFWTSEVLERQQPYITYRSNDRFY